MAEGEKTVSLNDLLEVDQVKRVAEEIDGQYIEWALGRQFPLREYRQKMVSRLIAGIIDSFLERERKNKAANV